MFPKPQKIHAAALAIDFRMRLPIYARLLVRHPDPNIAPFAFNGSLAKLGVREKFAAEELIDQWTVQFLSGQNRKLDPNAFKTVEQAIEDYLIKKPGTIAAT